MKSNHLKIKSNIKFYSKNIFVSLLIFLFQFSRSQTTERNLNVEKWTFSQGEKNIFLPAKVPGTIHTDLFRNKKIPDPFFGEHEKDLQWIEKENWVYRTEFQIFEKEIQNHNIELIFNGLDTYAKVLLNGKEILNADNMFRTWKIDAKKLLKFGKNSLEITFFSASELGKSQAKKLQYTLPENERVFVRKAQYHFGWDWGPRFVTAGIWKPVTLKFWNNAKIENVKTSQEIFKSSAKINIQIDIQAEHAGSYVLKINDLRKNILLVKGLNFITIPYKIKKPKLWYPNGYGKQNLYDLNIILSKYEIPRFARNDKKKENFLDEKNLKIGLRTIELVQKKDKIGESFYFKLNGIPVYAKGANMIPLHSFLPEIQKKDYENLIREAKFANMNMLRVWGGGIYEDDEFYRFCDENGILVWQDFPFACAMYPGDENFLNNVKNEVIDNVNRLQNHASLAIWCGNNENDEGWNNWGWQKQLGYSKVDSTKIWNDYVKVFREIIPKTLDSVSAQKPIYWQSSPKNGWGRKVAYEEGDVHYWGVWWGMEPFEKYREKVGRFVSEYGFQGMPPISTLQKIADFDPKSSANSVLSLPEIKNHQKHKTGYETIKTYMERDFPVPENFENFVYASQLLQAYGMKTAVEAHRTAKPYNMGTLYWQLNDVWPVTSWSSVDFFGNRKASHYQFKRSFENVLITVKETENAYQIYVVNDLQQYMKGGLNIDLIDFKGENIWNASGIEEIKPNSSELIVEIKKGDLPFFNKKNSVMKISFNGENINAISLYYFSKPKDLVLKKPKITITKINEKTIEINTDILAKDVYLYNKNGNLEDNFFDLLPGQRKIITSEKPIEIENVKTLYDVLNNINAKFVF